MSLKLKFNIVIILCCVVGVTAIYLLHRSSTHNRMSIEILSKAQMILEIAEAINANNDPSKNTTDSLIVSNQVFLQNSINQDLYQFKVILTDSKSESLQPNIWQTEIIQHFINNPNQLKLSGHKTDKSGKFFFLSEPIYQQQSFIGAKIAILYEKQFLEKNDQQLIEFIIYLISIILFILLIFNLLLSALILKPISKISKLADTISRGQSDSEELPKQALDEIGVFVQAFNRMHRSLKAAMGLLQKS